MLLVCSQRRHQLSVWWLCGAVSDTYINEVGLLRAKHRHNNSSALTSSFWVSPSNHPFALRRTTKEGCRGLSSPGSFTDYSAYRWENVLEANFLRLLLLWFVLKDIYTIKHHFSRGLLFWFCVCFHCNDHQLWGLACNYTTEKKQEALPSSHISHLSFLIISSYTN